MVLYILQQVVEVVNDLLSKLLDDREEGEFLLMVINNNNGVLVDKIFFLLVVLCDLFIVVDVVKDLINIVCGYEFDEEINVCGW